MLILSLVKFVDATEAEIRKSESTELDVAFI